MFQKRKFATRVLGFLFLSCRLISSVSATAAEALPQCSGSTYTDGNEDVNCSSASYYCTKTTGSNTTILKLIAEDSTAYCEEIKATSVNVFEVTKTTGASPEYTTVKVDLSGSTDPTDAEKLVIYSCNGTTCTREYGHIRVNNNYYTVGSTASKALNGSGYFLLTGASSDSFVSCELAATTGYPSTCTAVQTMTAGYFKNSEGDYYKCNGSTYEKMEVSGTAKTSCSGTGDFGSLINTASGFQFCLDNASNMIEFASDSTALHYMFSIGATSLFASTATANSYILLEVTDTSITKVADAAGYYIADTDLALLTQAGEGTLYSCSSGTCTIPTIAAKDVGYYKNTDTTVPYIKCYQDTATPTFKCKAIADSNTTACGTGTNGQLIQGGKLCLEGTIGKEFLSAGATAESYLMTFDSGSIYSSNIGEEGKYGIVTITENSMTIDTASTSTAAICVTNANLQLSTGATCDASTHTEYKKCSHSVCYNECNATDGKGCFATSYYIFSDEGETPLTAAGEGKLYYCATAGNRCTATTDKIGYFVNSDLSNKATIPYIECADVSGTITCKGIAKPTGSTCDNTTYGQLMMDSSTVKLCLDGTNKVAFGDSDTAKNYLVSYSSGNTFSNVLVAAGKYGVVAVNDHSMIIDATAQTNFGVCVSTGGEISILATETDTCTDPATKSTIVDFCSGGVCFLTCKVAFGTNCEAATYYLVDDDSLPVMSGTGNLYYCATAGTACTDISDIGYYVNNKDDAFYCDGTDCQIETIAAGTACDANNIGKLVLDSSDTTTGVALCLNFEGTTATKQGLSSTGNYLLAYSTATSLYTLTSGQFGAVAIKNKSVTLISETGSALENGESPLTLASADSTGVLYTCDSGKCTVTDEDDIKTGYYKNIAGTQYIKCIVTTTTATPPATTKTCTAITVTAASDCSGSNIKSGDIIEVTSGTAPALTTTYKICLTKTIPIELLPDATTNDGAYLVDVSGDGNIFGSASNGLTIVDISGTDVLLKLYCFIY